jgi:hypothetical protein
VKDVKRTAQGPREDQLAVLGDGAVDGYAVRACKNPIGDCFPAVRPREPETDTMQSFVDAHMPRDSGSMVGGEGIATKRGRNNKQH